MKYYKSNWFWNVTKSPRITFQVLLLWQVNILSCIDVDDSRLLISHFSCCCAWLGSLALLHTTSSRGTLVDGLGFRLLARGFSSSRFCCKGYSYNLLRRRHNSTLVKSFSPVATSVNNTTWKWSRYLFRVFRFFKRVTCKGIHGKRKEKATWMWTPNFEFFFKTSI